MMLALGYEDLNDHDTLRHDPLLATAIDVVDPTGMSRKRERDKGIPLAGKSTLNRLELTPEGVSDEERYKKIEAVPSRIEHLLVEHFLDSHKEPPDEIILDLDATDDPLHGKQEGRFFHGYYGHYCYLPLYIFCDDFLLCAKLRPSNIDGAAGAVEEVACIVDQIRERWPAVRIILRADSGFAREPLMVWAEESGVLLPVVEAVSVSIRYRGVCAGDFLLKGIREAVPVRVGRVVPGVHWIGPVVELHDIKDAAPVRVRETWEGVRGHRHLVPVGEAVKV